MIGGIFFCSVIFLVSLWGTFACYAKSKSIKKTYRQVSIYRTNQFTYERKKIGTTSIRTDDAGDWFVGSVVCGIVAFISFGIDCYLIFG